MTLTKNMIPTNPNFSGKYLINPICIIFQPSELRLFRMVTKYGHECVVFPFDHSKPIQHFLRRFKQEFLQNSIDRFPNKSVDETFEACR